jgi:hypothetical protein
MVTLSNWFFPEEIRRNGNGMPLASTYAITYFGWGGHTGSRLVDLILFSGQPVGAIVPDGALSWKTNIAASGVSLFGLGGLPVRIELPGGVSVVASQDIRPEAFRRNIPGASPSSFLEGDMALWLRVYVNDALAGEAWQEWDAGDFSYGGDAFQLSAGWCGGDGDESVYAHLLPFSPVNNLGRRNTGVFNYDQNRQFGVGSSIEVPLNGAFPGPAPIGIKASSTLWNTGLANLPVKWFTGHILPLGNRLSYLPTGETPAEQLAASPGAVFGWADHPAAAAVGHLPWSLHPKETNGALEWDEDIEQWGPRHLGAIAQYRYSDHAVVPASSGAVSNISQTEATNDRLNRIRVQWTFDKSILWKLFFGEMTLSLPSGQFTLESVAEGHGAWCEWSTKGFSSTSQSASFVSQDGTFSVVVEGVSASVKLRRHTLVNPSTATEPGDCNRLDRYELSWQVWIKGRSTIEGSSVPGDNSDTPFFGRYFSSPQTVFLSNSQAANILLGTPISPSNTFTTGTFTFTAVGPP